MFKLSLQTILFTYVKQLVTAEISEGFITAFRGFGPWSGLGEQGETNSLLK